MEFNEKKYKELLYPIIENYDSFCREHGLNYTIYAGTLLGAVRHGGMIPWDDDIDVLMPRPDYNRFIELASRSYRPGYRIVNAYTDPRCYTTFTKIVDVNTTLIEYELTKDAVLGAYIDVFPLDGIDNDPQKAEKDYLEYRKYQSKTRFARNNFSISLMKEHKVSFKGVIANHLHRMIYPNTQKMLVKCDKMASRIPFETALKTQILCSPNHSERTFPKEWFESFVDIKFDNLNLRAIKQWDKFLTVLFGNYMELPPIEKRISHHYHYYINLDHGFSYEELKSKGVI